MHQFDVAARAAQACVAGTTAAAAAVAQGAVSPELLVSPYALLLAFLGAGFVLSFLPPREGGKARMFATIFFCTLLGALGAPLALQQYYTPHPVSELLEAFAAFASASVAQIFLPMAIERRGDIWTWLLGFLPRRG